MVIDQMYGCQVVCADTKFGVVSAVFLDDLEGNPVYVTVRSGLFGNRETFLPLDGCVFENGQLRVPFTSDQVKHAPESKSEDRLDAAAEAEICQHYGVEYQLATHSSPESQNSEQPLPETDAEPAAN